MKTNLNLLTFVSLICISIASCKKNDVKISPDIPDNTTTTEVHSAIVVQGRILDDYDKPVGDVFITVGSNSTKTAANGYFAITATAGKNLCFIKIEKAGFFSTTRTIVSSQNDSNYVEVRLIPKTLAGSFDALNGGQVSANGNATISIPAGGVMDQKTKLKYNGTVNVYTYWLDPTGKLLADQMPGDLRAVRSNGDKCGLVTYGMLAVELQDQQGNKLQIAEDSKAQISMQIPASLSLNAPANIPLWWFDEESGLWKEEGTAKKQDGKYIGDVAHFSFWNLDYPTQMTLFRARVLDESANPIAYSRVAIYTENFGGTFCWSNGDGYISGWLPKNDNVTLALQNHCGEEFFSQKFFIVSKDSIDLGNITIPTSNKLVNITGTASNCDGTDVQNGVAFMIIDSLRYKAEIKNGTFKFSVVQCSASPGYNAKLWVLDVASYKQSDSADIILKYGENHVFKLSSCNTQSLREFIKVEFKGKSYVYTPTLMANMFFHLDAGDFINIYHTVSAVMGKMDYPDFTIDSLRRNWNVGHLASCTFRVLTEEPVAGSYDRYDLLKNTPVNYVVWADKDLVYFIDGNFEEILTNGSIREPIKVSFRLVKNTNVFFG